jgi:hypothetical protein
VSVSPSQAFVGKQPSVLALPNWGVPWCLPVVVQYVYVIGGVGPDGAVLSSIERLRLDSDGTATATGPNAQAQWELLPQPLNRARAGAYATVTLGGSRIQVFGGVGEDGQGLDSTEVLSAATGQHIASDRRGYGKRMNVPRSYVVAAAPAASATSDTSVVLLGADADPSANEVFTIISV